MRAWSKWTQHHREVGRRGGRRIWLASAAAAAVLAVPSGGYAQDEESAGDVAEEGGLDRIVVTARRREESLQEVPVSVAAFSAADLRSRSIDDVSQVGAFTPNLTFNTAGNAAATSTLAQVFVRGVGQTDFLPTADPGVGIYLDGVYLGRTVGGVVRMSDIERLEVLRGPQGTLFGRNTIGGAVNIVTQRPEDALGGSVEATVGDDAWYKLDGVFNAPLGDNAAVRLVGQYNHRDGYFDSTFRPDIDFGDENNYTLRGQVSWDGGPVRLLASADYYHQDQEARPTINIANSDDPTSITSLYDQFSGPLYGEPPLTPEDLVSLDDPFTGSTGGPSIDDADIWGVSLTGEWDAFANAGFKSITAYRAIDSRFASDNDGSFHTIAITDDEFEQSQFSQEFQFLGSNDRLSWVAGLYYFHEEASDENDVLILPGLFQFLEGLPTTLDCLAPPPIPTPPTCPAPSLGVPGGAGNPVNVGLDLVVDAFGDVTVDNYAVFGEADVNLTDALTLILGGRFTYEEKDFVSSQLRPASGVPALPLSEVSDDWSNFSPRVGLNYQLDNGAIAYFTYSQGFKSGTFNGRANSEQTLEAVDPEEVTAYEVGFKADLLDARLRVNAAAFYNDYRDIQLTAVIPDPLLGIQIFLINAGAADVYGGELEIAARPNEAWDFTFGAGYVESEVDGISPEDQAATGVLNGTVLQKTPEVTLNVSGQYTHPLNFGGLAVRLDYAWQDEMFHDSANSATTLEDAYGLLNGRATLFHDAKGWQAAAFATNIANQENFSTIFLTGGGQTTAIPNRGRSYGVTLRKTF
ncbi:MAG: TonB-dependent receptor [Caulobacterales bacterium]|nr:TonB-dependent receptor [Caulobacterales bacterium]